MTVSQRITIPGGFTVSTRPVLPAGSDTPAEQPIGAEFEARQISSNLVRVRVQGEIDIRNASVLRTYARRQLEASPFVVLDLSEVEFFGAAGLAVFEDLDEYADRSDARWALVCGHPVQRLLRVADTGTRIRVHASLECAMRFLGLAA